MLEAPTAQVAEDGFGTQYTDTEKRNMLAFANAIVRKQEKIRAWRKTARRANAPHLPESQRIMREGEEAWLAHVAAQKIAVVLETPDTSEATPDDTGIATVLEHRRPSGPRLILDGVYLPRDKDGT